jgi:hypothetical protein
MSKLGRNEPCHCGSGKKFKKCCLNKNKISLENKKTFTASIPQPPKTETYIPKPFNYEVPDLEELKGFGKIDQYIEDNYSSFWTNAKKDIRFSLFNRLIFFGANTQD